MESGWEFDLLRDVRDALVGTGLNDFAKGRGTRSYHLAVMSEPYLGWILDGTKRVESRFSRYRIAPYEQVAREDVLLFKRVSGPIVGVGRVAKCQFLEVDRTAIRRLRNDFSERLRASDPAFWRCRSSARYVSLIWVTDVYPLSPVRCSKKDRRPWVVLSEPL